MCLALQNHYMKEQISRYIVTLNNEKYIESIGMTRETANLEIRWLWDKHIELNSFCHIQNGRRQRKVEQIIHLNIFSDDKSTNK